eukprot:6476555-Amphidinium_carterae.5
MPSPGKQDRRTRSDPLPCALPYSWALCSAPRSSRRRAHWHKIRHRRQWVNASIAYLDWLYLRKPSGRRMAWTSTLAGTLTDEQHCLVSELESIYLAVCRLGEAAVEPSGGLSRLATDLHRSCDLGDSRLWNGSCKRAACSAEGVGRRKHVVTGEGGHCAIGNADDMPSMLPSWFMNVRNWPGIAKQLVRHGLCRGIHPSAVTTWKGQHLRARLFGVEKPQTSQRRVIVDRRRRNAVEMRQ